MGHGSRTPARALTVLTLCFTAYGRLPQRRRSDPNKRFPCLHKSGYAQPVSQCRHGHRTELHPHDYYKNYIGACDGLGFLATSHGPYLGDKFLCMLLGIVWVN